LVVKKSKRTPITKRKSVLKRVAPKRAKTSVAMKTKQQPSRKGPTKKLSNKIKIKGIKSIKGKIAKSAIKGRSAKPIKATKAINPPEAPKPIRMSGALEQSLMRRVITILSDCRIRQGLIEIGGENALAIVRNFSGNLSDEDLAKRLKIKISDVRATLNKLHNEGLVNYIREKDSETGWYSYSWSLNHERMEKWVVSHNSKMSHHGADDGSELYFCPSCGTESITSFESAAGCEFRCERCNKMMEFIDEKGITELFERKK
jgi:transcription initiation factor TFIIE subunit alpha